MIARVLLPFELAYMHDRVCLVNIWGMYGLYNTPPIPNYKSF
jgi:hypothetical protein